MSRLPKREKNDKLIYIARKNKQIIIQTSIRNLFDIFDVDLNYWFLLFFLLVDTLSFVYLLTYVNSGIRIIYDA